MKSQLALDMAEQLIEEFVQVIENIKYLISKVESSNICVRVPHIPEHNNEEDVQKSIAFVKELGVTIIDEFTYKIL